MKDQRSQNRKHQLSETASDVTTLICIHGYSWKSVDVDKSCSFCGRADESIHLFFQYRITMTFQSNLNVFNITEVSHCFTLKDIICDYDNTRNKQVVFYRNIFDETPWRQINCSFLIFVIIILRFIFILYY